MKYLKHLAILSFLASLPLFAQVCSPPYDQVDNSATDGECPCSINCNLTTGCCTDPVGNCECDWDCFCPDSDYDSMTDTCSIPWECSTDCDCLFNTPAATTAKQTAVLVYSSFNLSQTSALKTGMLGTSEGTFPDKKLVFIRDHKSPHKNEVEIRPTWCK